MRKRKNLIRAMWILVPVMLLLLLLFPLWISSIRPGVSLPRRHLDSLARLEEVALQRGEYPVGALVVYKGSIIGSGFNTFRDLNNPMGHAEINAIKDVFESMHYMDFRALDRDSLILISSYEPCMMCRGVLNHLDVREIYYVRSKKFQIRLKYLYTDFRYYMRLRRIRRPDHQ